MLTFIKRFDDRIITFIQQSVKRRHHVTQLAKLINTIGNGGAMWVVLAILLIAIGAAPYGYMIIFGDGFYFLICHQLIKKTLVRKRPFQDDPNIQLDINPPTSSSFPSGHVTIAFASTTVLFFLHPLAGILALIVALTIAGSRLYLLVHYPSDVLGGMVIGVLDGFLSVYLVTFLLQLR